MNRHTVMLGATSGIARACCHELAQQGEQLTIAGRNADELERIAADLQVRYDTQVQTAVFDALDFESHQDFVNRCSSNFEERIDCVVLCYGSMVDQATADADYAATQRVLETNFTSAVSILSRFAAKMKTQQSGVIVGVSSVAGDRGRQSNYVYGAAKSGLTIYLQGLRNAMYHHGVHVLTVKPGFVDTPMTHGLLNPKSPLVATPETVARDICKAIRKKKNQIYTPWFWRWIMTIICSIPEFIFKRLSL